jgi:hypothetical protein
VTTNPRPRTPGDRHFADQAVTSPTTPSISVFIHDEAINGKTNDGQQERFAWLIHEVGVQEIKSPPARRSRRAGRRVVDRTPPHQLRHIPRSAGISLLSVVAPADVAVTENAVDFAGLVGTVTPIVAK